MWWVNINPPTSPWYMGMVISPKHPWTSSESSWYFYVSMVT